MGLVQTVTLAGQPGIAFASKKLAIDTGGATPRFILTVERGFKMTGMDFCIALQNGSPSIHVDPSQAASGIIGFSPACVRKTRTPSAAGCGN
jgi:hypothetical protein